MKRYQSLLPWAVFCLLLFSYHLIFQRFFPGPRGRVGHDFALSMPALLDGFLWFRNNGPLEVPWFTPSFCGGQPFFPDPQSAYYSLPQFLTFLTDPLTASYLTLLAFAALGFWGFYLLLRLLFGTDRLSALTGGALYMFNGFLSHRMILGESGYHGITLTPWIALLLLCRRGSGGWRAGDWAMATAAGVLIAYWLHSGLATLMIPAGLGVFLIACVLWLEGESPGPFLRRTTVAVTLSVALCAAKLVASLSFLGHFPRTYYPLPGAAGIAKTLSLVFKSLSLSSETVFADALDGVVNVQWTIFPHEWAYGVTPFPPVIILAGILLTLLRGPVTALSRAGRVLFSGPRSTVTTCAGLISLLVPVSIATYYPGWSEFLKHVPLINAMSHPFRWFLVYIPVAVLAASLILDRHGLLRRFRLILVPVGILAPVLFSALEGGGYYSDQPYDPRPVMAAYRALGRGWVEPEIRDMGVFLDVDGQMGFPLERNDSLIFGISQLACYNPTFGYRLERFPIGKLRPGPVLGEEDGILNLKNPVCYVFPRENGCEPGDHFLSTQRRDAESFVKYRPIPFRVSKMQRAAGLVTTAALLWTAGFFLWFLLRAVFRRVGGRSG